MKSRCILMTGVNKVELGEFDIGDPGEKEVLIENKYTCISPGTELRCLSGKQSGAAFPFIPGYAATGVVIKAGKDSKIAEGTKVFIGSTQYSGNFVRQWGGHTSHAIVNDESVYIAPDSLSLAEASLAKMCSIAYHGYRLAQPMSYETVAVIGLGILGQMSARLFSMSGANTVACDLAEFRVQRARQAGVTAAVLKGTIKETIKPLLPEGADIIVDVTGAAPVINNALQVARDLPWDNNLNKGPRYVLQGSYAESFTVDYNTGFLNEVSFLMPRDCQPRDIRAVLDLLSRGKLDFSGLLEIRKPGQAQQTYEQLMDKNFPMLTAAFAWTV